MKFGTHLEESLNPDWRFQYLDYNGLKKEIKLRCAKGVFTENDETEFVQLLEAELDKIVSFRNLKTTELTNRIGRVESALDALRAVAATSGAAATDQATRLEAELGDIVAQLTSLSKYVRLNYSGFLKIVKKHDKHTPFRLRPAFGVRLSAHPFYKIGFDALILRISRAYDALRASVAGDSAAAPAAAPAGAASQQFVRKTTKYWVHPDNVTEVKCIVLKYLPVLVFASKSGSDFDPCISSVYFDNDAFELYTGRLEKSEGAEAVRLRWYGGMDNPEIFVERKTHREDWTGEKSVKERFVIKEKHVNEYLGGTYTMEKSIGKMRARQQKTAAELDSLSELSSAVQRTVGTRKLKPILRTMYNRTAFQLPGDARVRISLDADLCMVREDNFDRPRSGSNWRRVDVGTDFEFGRVPTEDVERFPYAVLEVKLQTQVGAEAPAWVERLVQSHLVEPVPKFSKYIHGVATLLESHVTLLPFWLPQMEKDIRKPPSAAPSPALSLDGGPVQVVIEDAIKPASSFGTPAPSRGPSGAALLQPRRPNRWTGGTHGDEATPLLEDDEHEAQSLASGSGALGHAAGPSGQTADASSGTLSSSGLGSGLAGGRPRGSPARKFWRAMNGIVRHMRHQPGNGFSEMERERQRLDALAREQNKRIALPVRVEPKVFFANERTFLQWLNFCITLGGLAIGLVNFGDRVGRISGALFTAIAVGFMFYSTYVFQWRARMIRERRAAAYDDRLGPTVLVGVLFCAILANFMLKFTDEP